MFRSKKAIPAAAPGRARVLRIKSGLHLDKDGPRIPVRTLVADLLDAVQPFLFITAGPVAKPGSGVLPGDIVIAKNTRFSCTKPFRDVEWKAASCDTSPLPSGALAAIWPSLTRENASRIEGARPVIRIWHGSADVIVTMDFSGFGDSTNYYGLPGRGRTCETGDAMVGQALRRYPVVRWYAVRNASDPQIPNPSGNIHDAEERSGEIYVKYGALTTAASVIACRAIIRAAFT